MTGSLTKPCYTINIQDKPQSEITTYHRRTRKAAMSIYNISLIGEAEHAAVFNSKGEVEAEHRKGKEVGR